MLELLWKIQVSTQEFLREPDDRFKAGGRACQTNGKRKPAAFCLRTRGCMPRLVDSVARADALGSSLGLRRYARWAAALARPVPGPVSSCGNRRHARGTGWRL